MHKLSQILIGRLRWFGFGVPVLLATLLILALVPTAQSRACLATRTNSDSSMALTDGQNAIADGLTAAADATMRGLNAAGHASSCSGQSALRQTIQGTAAVGHGFSNTASFIGRGLGSGGRFMASAVSGSIVALDTIPGAIFGIASNTAVVSAVIKPSSNMAVPTIDRLSPAQVAAHATLASVKTINTQPVSQITPLPDSTPAWPIHGEITTMFGVPHWPYQPTHTGLDISDGKWSGSTEIKPFKPGTVIDVIHSNIGLGNHIIIDHGDGLTSVYGHLYSTAVQIGQVVDKNTTLGLEGTTGASTGPHLHFEIRVDGVAKDPLQYISGRP